MALDELPQRESESDMEGGSPSTVFVVDDALSVRNSLVYLLESIDLQTETFASGPDYLDAFDPDRPGCLLLDVRMPEMDGLTVQKRLIDRNCRLPIIVISGHADVAMAVEAMQRGAFDFVEKPFNENELLERVQRAISVDRAKRARFHEKNAIRERLERLTPREIEVLDLVVQGYPTREIAKTLGTSFNTVQNQRASILRKKEAKSVADLVRMVMIARTPDDL